jgi:RNA polymerase sigma-70 factor, ECF subfamily
MTPSDLEDLVRLREGDAAAAMVSIVEKYSDRVKFYILKQVKDRDRANEITHVALIQFYKKVCFGSLPLEEYESIPAMLKAAATSLLIDEIRHERKDADIRTELFRLPWRRPKQPDELALTKEMRRMVRQAIEQLPDSNRKQAALVYLDDLTIAEAAKLTGQSPEMTTKHLSRARKALRQLLEPYWKGDVYADE